jgi:hypothetical protein
MGMPEERVWWKESRSEGECGSTVTGGPEEVDDDESEYALL